MHTALTTLHTLDATTYLHRTEYSTSVTRLVECAAILRVVIAQRQMRHCCVQESNVELGRVALGRLGLRNVLATQDIWARPAASPLVCHYFLPLKKLSMMMLTSAVLVAQCNASNTAEYDIACCTIASIYSDFGLSQTAYNSMMSRGANMYDELTTPGECDILIASGALNCHDHFAAGHEFAGYCEYACGFCPILGAYGHASVSIDQRHCFLTSLPRRSVRHD
jgi:hypothetical protein